MAELHDNIYVHTVSTVFFCQAFWFLLPSNIFPISFSKQCKPCIMQSVTRYKIKMWRCMYQISCQHILKLTHSWRMDFDWNTSSHSLKSLWTLLIYYSLYCWLSVIAWSCQCSLNSQYMPTTLIQCIPSLFFTTMFVTNTLLLVGCTSRVRSGCNGDLTIN